jgi:hypothetical protein
MSDAIEKGSMMSPAAGWRAGNGNEAAARGGRRSSFRSSRQGPNGKHVTDANYSGAGGAGRHGPTEGAAEDAAGKVSFTPYHAVTVPRSVNLEVAFKSNTQKPVTTAMLRNIPNKYTQASLLHEIDCAGFEGTYDFFYLPMDTQNRTNVGYAFINFQTPACMCHFTETFSGHAFREHASQKRARVTPAHLQGFQENVRHFSNRAVTHSRNSQYRPVVVHHGQLKDLCGAVSAALLGDDEAAEEAATALEAQPRCTPGSYAFLSQGLLDVPCDGGWHMAHSEQAPAVWPTALLPQLPAQPYPACSPPPSCLPKPRLQQYPAADAVGRAAGGPKAAHGCECFAFGADARQGFEDAITKLLTQAVIPGPAVVPEPSVADSTDAGSGSRTPSRTATSRTGSPGAVLRPPGIIGDLTKPWALEPPPGFGSSSPTPRTSQTLLDFGAAWSA